MPKVGKYCSVLTAGGRKVLKRITLSDEEYNELMRSVIEENSRLLRLCFEKARVLSSELGVDEETIALALFEKVGVHSFTLIQAALDEKVNKIKTESE